MSVPFISSLSVWPEGKTDIELGLLLIVLLEGSKRQIEEVRFFVETSTSF